MFGYSFPGKLMENQVELRDKCFNGSVWLTVYGWHFQFLLSVLPCFLHHSHWVFQKAKLKDNMVCLISVTNLLLWPPWVCVLMLESYVDYLLYNMDNRINEWIGWMSRIGNQYWWNPISSHPYSLLRFWGQCLSGSGNLDLSLPSLPLSIPFHCQHVKWFYSWPMQGSPRSCQNFPLWMRVALGHKSWRRLRRHLPPEPI